ncbi:predicted protein [Chaetomium globosum CBS 148.51]|uniref:Uncharacterized protein n=1 Tax=Chaetomium globosum (strain ATCC 6205 / CBS 148.51 / DSM 1962 / NBRC 6347 / NRRL 1970) TaxID=306901 RepID=Q2GWW3_CHAGB|nr:uncharacterized protein CHGG_07541 [Chaetomium globosum CBS 148.51]EAQ86288.1 predicted protein [Chaetomium globosum CBS 148.51]
MCWYRHYNYACGHPAPDGFSRACEAYPTCNRRNFEGGTFVLRTDCPACIYDKAPKKKSGKSTRR